MICISGNTVAGYCLFHHFIGRTILVSGPSMLPTLDEQNNLLGIDCFTHRFIRNPKKGEVIIAWNPFKPNLTVIKRVKYTEGEMAEFMDLTEGKFRQVKVPPNHIWVEGDNASNSRDSRSYGPLSLGLMIGIASNTEQSLLEADQFTRQPSEDQEMSSVGTNQEAAALNREYLYLQSKELALKVQTLIETRTEPVQDLHALNQLLNMAQVELREHIMDLNAKKDFYKIVLKQTADKVLQEKQLTQPGYLQGIFRFFRNILVNFFPYGIEDEALGEIVHSLFNLDAPLYTFALQSNYKKQLNQDSSNYMEAHEDDLTLEQRRIKSEHQWRSQLKEGDKIDAILQRLVMNSRIGHWAPAVIHQVMDPPDQFYISFENEPGASNRLLNRFGAEIAFPGTFTDDFEWRYSIKTDQLLDSLDSEAIWYKSTILDTRGFKEQAAQPDDEEAAMVQNKQKEAYVAFRYYDEEEGHKIDDIDGRKFIGWSNKYDEWQTVTSPTIQKLGTICKYYRIAGKQSMKYDSTVDDICDVLHNTSERKVWAMFRNNFFSNLKCIPDYFNEFGMREGFEKILDFFNDVGKQKSLKHLHYLIEFLNKSQPLWHRQFQCYYIPKIRIAFERALLFTTPEGTGPTQIKFPKESLAGIQKAFQGILRRHYTQDVYSMIMAELNFNLGFSLLKSVKLEQRVQGIKEVIEQIKNTKFSARMILNAKQVIQRLKQSDIFEAIFGEHYHIQLIQRSSEIIKFYINEKEITEKEIEYIWQATKKDQQTKMEIYKIISDIAIMFKNDEIEILVERFAQVPPDQFVEKEIECVYELSKYSYKQASFSVRAAQLFWDIAVQERPYKKQIIEMAIDKFIDLIRNWDREQKGEFIYRCIEKIRNHSASVQCLKIIQKILEQIPNYRVNNQATLNEISAKLILDSDLINMVIYDFIHYSDKANDLWTKGILTSANIEALELLDVPFSHRSHSFTRLNFIRNVLQNSLQELNMDQLDQIWDLMMVRSQISIDSDIFFNWFKLLLNDNNKLSLQLILHFFQTKVCAEGVSFKYIKKAGFDCICNIFLQINEQEENIQIISLPNANNTKLDFKVHVPPKNLVGIDVIWKLLTESDKKNVELTSVIIDLLTKAYHNLSPSLESQVTVIQDQFCQESLHRLEMVIMSIEATKEEKKQFTESMTLMIKSFFKDTERNGSSSFKAHSSIDRGMYLERIVIQNNVTHLKGTPRYIEFSVYSNMTVWQLKKLVASKIKQSPLRIQLQRADSKKKPLTDLEHLCPLREMKLESYELIYVQKKPLVFQPRISLLTKKKDLIPEAKVIFESWFYKFSNEEGFMTPETCVAFIKNSTQDHTVTHTDSRIVRLFNEYDKDIDGKITLEDFMDFYKDRAVQKPDLVWSNLNSHGIGNDLKPQNNQYLSDDPNEVKDPSALPRYKLSTDSHTFSQIFALLSHAESDTQESLWNMIGYLRTSPQIYSHLLSLQNLEESLDLTGSVHKILYSAQIIESLINEHQVKQPEEIKCYYIEATNDYDKSFPQIDENIQQTGPSLSPDKMEPDNLNEQTRETQSAAPVSGAVIALPAAPAEFEQNKLGNIPHAPPLQIPFIGPLPPQNQGNNLQGNQGAVNQAQIKLKEMLDNFKGQIISEPFDQSSIPDQEIAQILGLNTIDQVIGLKNNWMSTFVTKGGFKILMNSLVSILSLNNARDEKEVLTARAEKECITQLMRLLKTLVLSAFIANAGSAELSLELTRKMSASQATDVEQILENLFEAGSTNVVSSEQSAAVEAKKSTIQIQHEETEKVYEPLINVLKGDIAQHILESIDFKAFQEEILSIILTVLKKKERLGLDDKSIVDQALSLWITVIIYNSELLQHIYSDQEISRKANKQSVIETLLEQGMFCANFAIRSCFRDSFKILFQCVKTQTLETPPYIFFLGVMLQNINMTEFKSNEAKQFFETLRILLHQYFEAQKAQSLSFQKILNEREILQEFIIRLQQYESREKKGQLKEDANLLGIIQIICDFIKNDATILNPDEYRALLLYIVESCLFTKNIEPLNVDITQKTDIIAYEKPHLNKCQVTDSRGAAYTLLQLICVNNPQLIVEIIKEHLNPLVYKVNKPQKQGFAPRHETRSWHGYCGFVNLASICYMIAMIQQLYHVPAFRYLLLAAKPTDPLNPQKFEGDTVEDNMLHQLIKLMGFMELSERQAYNPREFCFSFKTFDGQPTNVRIQQDSYEFLNIAYERIENMLAKTSQKYLLQSVFGGELTRIMICQSCGNLRQSTEEFYAMSLEVKNMKSIYDGLRKVISGEIINDYKCESCNQKVDIVRKTAIEQLPNMLIVHLQRLYFDMDTFQNQKLNSRVEFPNVLNVKPFMINEVLKQEKDLMKKSKKDKRRKEREDSKGQAAASLPREEGKEDGDDIMEVNVTSPEKPINQQAEESSSDDEHDINMQVLDEEEDFQYKLVGVVVHMGVADAGHYISYINIARSQKNESDPEWLLTEKEKWLEFNDSTVKDYRFTNLDEDCFGGGIASNTDMKDHTKNAYLLMYEKRRKRDIKVVLTEESMVYQQNLAAQTSVDLSPPEELKNVMSVCPSLQEKLKDCSQIMYDEEKKEHYALVGFKDAQKFVPNDIYVKVHEDNYRFMCERQVFSNTFFESTKSILQQLYDKQPELLDPSSEDSPVLFSFVKRVLFDLLQMTTENKQLLDMTKLLLNMMTRNHQQLLELIDERVLVDKKLLGKDERTFLENLLANQEKEIREMHGLIAVFSVNKCLEKGDIGIVDAIMDQTWAMLPDEASKYWIKMHQFLDFIFQVTRSGNAQLCYMIQHQAVSKLIDFYLESESPKAQGKKRQQMGSSYANPPFEPLILAVSYIVRSYPYVDMGAGEFPYDTKSFQMINFFPGEIPPLTQSDLDFLRLKQFYAKNLKSGFERQEFGRLITHLSFGNYHFSRMICKRVLIGINKASQDEIEPYLHAIVLLLLLNDQFKQQRYEWLLGVPQLKIDKTTIYHSLNQTSQSSKLGVALIDAANDDVYEYKSTLFKQTSNIKESYLQIVYQYRKKWVKFSMNCLNALLQSCQQDLTGKLALYLKTLDPPNYTYARYIDWIKPYLVDQIQFMMKNSNIQSVQQDLVLAMQLNSIYDQIFGENIAAKNDQAIDKKLPRQVIQHDSSDGGPEQYLMWNIVEEKIINELNIFDDQITLTVKQLAVRIGESKPDGLSNQSFPPGHFSYNTRHVSNNHNDNTGYSQQEETGNIQGGRRIPAYGRGQNQHYNVVDQRPGHTVMQPSQSRKAPSRTNKKKRYTVQVRPEAQGNNQDADVQFDSNQQEFNGVDNNYGVPVEQEYNGQDSHQQLEEQHNQDDSMEVEYNNDHSDQSGDNSNREECFDHAAEFKVQQDGEAQYEQIDTSIHPQDQLYQAQQDPEMEDIPQEQEQVVSNKIDDEVWEATCDVVLVFNVRNFNEHKAQTVQLTFFDNSEPGTLPLNTRLPKSTLPVLLMGGINRDIFVMTKLRPFEDWGDYNYKLDIVRAQALDKGQPAGASESTDGYANQGFQTGNDVGVEGYNDLMEAQMAQQKECGACTFLNDSFLTICELCGTVLK